MEKMLKAGSVKHATVLSESPLFNVKDSIPTTIPIINIALSGRPDGGLTSGLTFLAGESKNFKSLLGLIMVNAYLKKYPEAVCLYYDTEFGTTPPYVAAVGIDTDRVLHIPIEHLEQLKFDISKRLDTIERGDKYIIFIDSIGNISSKKELEDALEGKSVADMTRAKVLKSLWRIVTPSLTTKDIPCVAINHTYKTMEMYAKDVMSGGTGGMYSANQVFIITKAQEKEGTELMGYKFTINIEKSRFVREKSKFPFFVKFQGGIDKWSGLFELAVEGGFIDKVSAQKYAKIDPETGEVSTETYFRKELTGPDFWVPILKSAEFKKFIEDKYAIGTDALIEFDEESEVLDD